MSTIEEDENVRVDFARAASLIPLLEKDIASLEHATENYWKNFLRFKVKFLSLFHSAGEAGPDPDEPLNQAAAGLELSNLIQLYNAISDEDSLTGLLGRVEHNNERLRAACALLSAYVKHFQK